METARVQLKMPADWKAAFQARAEELGEDLTTFILKGAKQRLNKATRDKLSERRSAGRPRGSHTTY